MRCDAAGNLYVTRWGSGLVVKISPEGKLLETIKLQGMKPTNIAFGGKDGKTAYVTLADRGNVETFRVETPGRSWTEKRIRGLNEKIYHFISPWSMPAPTCRI